MRYSLLICALVVGPAGAGPAKPAGKPPAKAPAKPAARAGAGADLPSKLPMGSPFATINGTAIPVREYVDRLSIRFGPDVREMLIHEELVRQEAKRRKIGVSPAEIDAAVQRAYRESVQRAGSESALAEELKQTRGWTPQDYRAVIRSQAGVQVLQEKLVAGLVKADEVKDADVEARYEQARERFAQPDRVSISHILIRRGAPLGSSGEDAAARKRAEDLLRQLRGGASFEQLAKEHSADMGTAARGGKIPTEIPRGANPFGAEFEAQVYNAPVGLVDRVIPSPMGYHLIRVDAKHEGRVIPLSEVREQLRTALLFERRREKLDALMLKLRATAKIELGKF